MLSICIPVFNFDITSLIEELNKQIKTLETNIEIIIIDDGSEFFKETNQIICQKHNYIELTKNIGRAKIRNLFLKYALYDYLLFLDCDSKIISSLFLKLYIDNINQQTNVVCGGRNYNPIKPKRNKLLRWKYGIQRESKDVLERGKSPYLSFMTNNFLVKKNILQKYPFDERIKQYGHEDTLFGLELLKNNISVLHINNPIENGEIEDNQLYIKKTKESITSLCQIMQNQTLSKDLLENISLIKFYFKYKNYDVALLFIFRIIKPFLLFSLKKGYFLLIFFDFYKLGELISSLKKKNSF
ncbi:MAG: glycosyltransferase [Flavobacteriia bacterium]|nr:glycosyltransferase [Flavobacteriia bacterium]